MRLRCVFVCERSMRVRCVCVFFTSLGDTSLGDPLQGRVCLCVCACACVCVRCFCFKRAKVVVVSHC